ncbi:unnamed protein product [Urochloa decumbens]|uniref:CCHC-type domain-containing protein n=1 Tax=Urochloa decumbens TaxID=240449 RepID=A0ABC9CC43_9POAL
MSGTSRKESSLVSLHYPMLMRSNYTTWAIKMKVFMRAQDVWDLVEYSGKKEEFDTKKDQTTLAAIFQGIPGETLLAVSEKETSKEAWECIKTMYQGAQRVKDARVQTLREDLDGLQMKSTDSIDDLVMKVNSIVSMIRGLGDKLEDSYLVKKILRAATNKFLQIVTSIEQFGDLTTMTVEEVFGRLRAYEERMCCGDNDDGAEQVLLTKVQWKAMEEKDDYEYLKQTRAQWRAREQKNGNKNQKFDKAKVRCYKCNNYGHFQWECDESKKEEKAFFMATDQDHPSLL